MKEYWLNKVIVGDNYKIKEVELVEVNKCNDTTLGDFEEVNLITVTKQQLLEMYKNNWFMNIEALTEDSITVSKKAYNIYDMMVLWVDENDYGYSEQYPDKLLIRESNDKCKRTPLDDDETYKKLTNYVNKLKLQGSYDNYNIDINNLILYNMGELTQECKLPPVRIVNCLPNISIQCDKVETLVFSKETTRVRFPFGMCKNIKNLIFGENTEEIQGIHMLKELNTLDIGGAFDFPVMSKHAKINKVVVSTRCEISNTIDNAIYTNELDIKHLTIKEFSGVN